MCHVYLEIKMSKTNSQTAKSSTKKGSSNKSPVAQKILEKAATTAAPEAEGQATALAQPEIVGDFSPIELPMVGPLARKENADRIAELASNLGIPIKSDGDGHLQVGEMRSGSDRRQDGDRRNNPLGADVNTVLAQGDQRQAEAPTGDIAEGAVADLGTGAPAEAPADAPADNPPQPEQAAAPQPNVDAFRNAIAALAAQMGIPAESVMNFSGVAATPRTGRPNQNGISRPGLDTKTGTVWRIADEITAKKGAAAGIGDLKAHPDLRNFNDHTIRTQYARWRQFNGVSGRTPSEEGNQPRQQAKPAAQAFEPMDDETFQFIANKRANNTASAFQLQWLEAEENRRNPNAASVAPPSEAIQPKQIQAAAVPLPENMSDDVYNNLLLMEKNNTLPDSFKSALAAAKQLRNEK